MSGARTTTAGSTGVLLGLAILLAGVAAWPWLAADEAVTVAPPVGPVSPALPSAADPRALSTVLERPLFAPGRRPVAAEGSAPPASAPRTALRVEGVVDAGGRRRVILRRDGEAAGLHLAEGESVDGWTVRSIAADRVVLVSPAGELVLPAR